MLVTSAFDGVSLAVWAQPRSEKLKIPSRLGDPQHLFTAFEGRPFQVAGARTRSEQSNIIQYRLADDAVC